jgi:signal transduction histidine kinase
LPSVYILIPLLACLASALSALAILLRDPAHPGNRVATALVAVPAFWALCQVLWMLTPDAETAVRIHGFAAFGWGWIGPLSLHLVLEVTQESPRWMRRTLPALYAISGGFALLSVTTPWLHGQASPAPWGWAFEPGPAWVPFYAFTMGCVAPAAIIGLRGVRSGSSPVERRQVRIIALGVAVPLVVTSLTATVLPMLQIQLPRLSSASLAVLGVVIAYSYHRYGFSALAPGSFSREVLEMLPEGIALVGLDGSIRSANEVMAGLIGLPPAQIVGIRIEEHLSHPVIDPPRDLREVECEFTSASGRIPVALSTSRMCDKQGRPFGVIIVVRDLREVVDLRNRLVTSGRLAAVGELAAGIAHEINNPTAYVRANLGQLREAWAEIAKRLPPHGEDPELDALFSDGEDLIDESLEGVERTVAVVRDVKGFAHRGAGVREVVDLNELLREVIRMAQLQLRDRVAVEFQLGENSGIWGVPQQLKQLFLNLVVNANQAIGESGAIRVITYQEDGCVIARIEDDGCGISSEERERIFDPFFTTKPVGEGTGLGLAISYQIVRNHGAELVVDSEPGRGTVVSVSFDALELIEAAPAAP